MEASAPTPDFYALKNFKKPVDAPGQLSYSPMTVKDGHDVSD
jgi:hypothetical protein